MKETNAKAQVRHRSFSRLKLSFCFTLKANPLLVYVSVYICMNISIYVYVYIHVYAQTDMCVFS